MKTVKISALVLAMTGVFATSANAQSTKTNAWEGFYGQVGVGYGMFVPKIGSGAAVSPTGLASNTGYPSTVSQSASASSINNVNTGLVNLAAGYNFGISEVWVLGVAATYYPGASSSANGQLSAAPTTMTNANGNPAYNVPIPGASTTATYNVKNLYSVVLTPGYAIDKDRLAYAKVGYTGATIGLNGPSLAYQSTNLTGYTLGLGYKQMISQSLYAFGEVNYASYGTKSLTATLTTGTQLQGMTVSGVGTDVLVGVGYRF